MFRKRDVMDDLRLRSIYTFELEFFVLLRRKNLAISHSGHLSFTFTKEDICKYL